MIIIGDVHGCYDTLMELVKQFPKDQTLCFVGDLVDRGPKSAEVVEWVKSNGHLCVMGNHENKMIKAYDHPTEVTYWQWLNLYFGHYTMGSYKDKPKEMIKDHIEWMRKLPKFLHFKDIKDEKGRELFVSHAGIADYRIDLPFEVSLSRAVQGGDIMYTRDPLANYPTVFQVIGHTPQEGGPTIQEHYANVDTGCCFAKRADYGKLTAIQFPTMQVYSQPLIEGDGLK